MLKCFTFTLLLCIGAIGQNGQAGKSITPSESPASQNNQPAAGDISPDTPVLTIKGVCDHPSGQKPGPDCRTVITRAQFESMIRTVQPNLPPTGRRQFAQSYVEALVADEQARDTGAAQGPKFELKMRIAWIQSMAQELGVAIYQNAMNVSDKQIEDYYRQNPDLFVEADLTRMLVPGIQQLPEPPADMSPEEREKRIHDSEALMKATAERMRLRVIAGDDLAKLQAEAFQIALVTGEAPPTKLGKVRGMALPPSQVSIMELKTGEVSQLILDHAGYLIYKVGEKRVQPLDEVRNDIKKHLVNQGIQSQVDSITNASTTTLDETYFGK